MVKVKITIRITFSYDIKNLDVNKSTREIVLIIQTLLMSSNADVAVQQKQLYTHTTNFVY
jgi:hypothetical protein